MVAMIRTAFTVLGWAVLRPMPTWFPVHLESLCSADEEVEKPAPLSQAVQPPQVESPVAQ